MKTYPQHQAALGGLIGMILTGCTASLLAISSTLNAAAQETVATDQNASAQPLTSIEDLGEPVWRHQALGTAIGPGSDGRPQAFFLIRGNATTTTEFAVVDLRSREIIFDERLPRGSSSGRTMDYSSADGNVYFGVDDTGELFRYKPASKQIESLGIPLEGQRIWGLYAAPDGMIWGGTYPGGQVFSYNPKTGQVRDYGQAIEKQQYAHSFAQVGDMIYVGTGSLPHSRKLAKLNPKTGEFIAIPLPDGHDEAADAIKNLYVRKDMLLALCEAGMFVYDLSKNEWVDHVEEISGRGVSPVDPSTGNAVYFRIKSGCLVRYDLNTLSYTKIEFCPNAFPEVIRWIDMDDPDYPGQTLALTYWRHARIYVHNFQSGKGYYLQPNVMGAGAQLTELGAGPDGDIYAGAYLSPPGMARWNPDQQTWTLLSGVSQVEGYGTFKGNLLFGIYPTGALYRFNPDQPWDTNTNPGKPAVIGHDQNRPQTFIDLGDQVAVGSVPKAGHLGGAITLWNPDTGDLRVFRNVIPEQTPVCLIYREGLIYGGTSIYGGYGVDPTTTEAHLFIWNPDNQQIIFQIVPVPGASYVSGLAFDDQGYLWGLAGNAIFQFDPSTRKVLRAEPLFSNMGNVRYGDDEKLIFIDNELFGVADNRLFRFDTTTWQTEVLHAGDSLNGLAVDRYGDLYYMFNGSHVYRYRRSR